MHWTEAFTTKLVGAVKQVGSAVSCEGAPRDGDAAGPWRSNPHVLPYAWVTDAAGWALLHADPDVFKCYASDWDTRYHSDVGASLLLLKAGHNLDCLLTRYQGVDWWSEEAAQCNERCACVWRGGWGSVVGGSRGGRQARRLCLICSQSARERP